jgi:thiol-disulfide isomerase/thioredoxin
VRRLGPQFTVAVDNLVHRLMETGAGATAPKVGEPMPSFLLPDEQGRLVGLEDLLGEGPVAIAFHRGYWCPYCRIGTGLNDAIEREKQVSIFKRDADDRGTPFIEVDRNVVEYVANEGDNCVKDMFSRYMTTDGDLAALFPFKRLNHSFMIGGFGMKFEPEKERASVNAVRGWIRNMKEQVIRHVDPSDPSAVRKGGHYIRVLDAQLAACDKTEEMIDMLMQPFPARRES